MLAIFHLEDLKNPDVCDDMGTECNVAFYQTSNKTTNPSWSTTPSSIPAAVDFIGRRVMTALETDVLSLV